MRRVLLRPLLILLALVFLFEAWLWDRLAPIVGWVVARIRWTAFKASGPNSRKTVVSWTMIGKKVFITKLFSLVMSMDKMLGGMFEQGLGQLKAVVEGSAKA